MSVTRRLLCRDEAHPPRGGRASSTVVPVVLRTYFLKTLVMSPPLANGKNTQLPTVVL